MPKGEKISMSVIKRMPRYFRLLDELNKLGIERISSRELSIKMGFTASQIRQDLNCFGGFGQQGYGYNVKQLKSEIGNILGVDSRIPTILIGTGNLGRAVSTHLAFSERGFDLIGLFDKSPSLIGEKIKDLTIMPDTEIGSFCREHKPIAAVLCVPNESTQKIVEELVELGVTNFWNFTHYDIASNFKNTVVESVHLNDSLMTLNYRIKHSE